jgi:hypothetical protein
MEVAVVASFKHNTMLTVTAELKCFLMIIGIAYSRKKVASISPVCIMPAII